MGDRVAIDHAIGMGWQVHSRDYVLGEYPSGSGKQWDVFGLDDGFEPPLDLLKRFINRHQRAAGPSRASVMTENKTRHCRRVRQRQTWQGNPRQPVVGRDRNHEWIFRI